MVLLGEGLGKTSEGEDMAWSESRSGLGDRRCLWEVWGLSKSQMNGHMETPERTKIRQGPSTSIPCSDTKLKQSSDLAIPSTLWLLSPSLGWHLEA